MAKKINIYLPVAKAKKSDIRGFWLSEDKKLYYDYIRVIKADISKIEFYKQKYKQEAIFYTCNGKAYIYHNRYKIEALNKKIEYIFIYGICSIKKQLKKLLKKYGGFTVYIKSGYILAEVWQ